MSSRRRERGSGRWKTVLGGVVVLVLLAGAGLSWQQGWADEWLERAGVTSAAGDGDPAAVKPPAAVDVPPVVAPGAVAAAAAGANTLDRTAVRSALAQLANPNLGKRVLAAVGPLEGTGFAYRSGVGVAVPASTTKLVTTAAALFLLGPDKAFQTTAVLDKSTTTPRVVIVGGGDPYLARKPVTDQPGATYAPPRADVQTLARATAKELKSSKIRKVRVGYDDTLFSGPSANPRWEADYVPDDIVAPISPLWVDEGREVDSYDRVADPAATAGAEFAAALHRAGIKVVGAPTRGPAAGAAPLASVTGPTVAQIVQRVLEVSDNEGAEILLRQVGLADQGEGSFAAGQKAVQRFLGANKIPLAGTVLYDGSGLSRQNRMSPSVLLGVLRLAASDGQPKLRSLLTSLPVAGFTGSLADRMDHGPAAGRGRVRAKTGTLTNVSALAGYAEDLDGNLMAFVLMADRIAKPKGALAQTALDDAAAGLGACHCGR